jgi:hypothetical protein
MKAKFFLCAAAAAILLSACGSDRNTDSDSDTLMTDSSVVDTATLGTGDTTSAGTGTTDQLSTDSTTSAPQQ